jgi:tetratricopeptide (TPR) repeat protein
LKPSKILVTGVMLLFLVLLGFGMAQEIIEDTDQEESTGNCIPETLTTVYDKFKDETIPQEELRKWYSFGSEYFKNKNYESAIPYLWKVFINDTSKNGFNAVRKLAESYYNLQRADSTLIVCYRGLEKYPNNMTLHYYAGYIQDRLGKYRCAIPHYEALVEDQPKTAEYLNKLAFLYYKDGNKKAIEIQERLVALDPTNEEYNRTLFQYNEVLVGKEGVLQAMANAYTSDPKNVDIDLKYGIALNEAGEYKKAIEPLNTVLKLDDKNVKAYEYRAMSYEGLENFSAAITDYKKILEIEPNNAEVICDIAANYRNLNQFANAKYWVGRALNVKPGYGLAYIRMAETYERAVTFCQNSENRGRKYDDGLVYELAYREYEKAQNDPEFRNTAKNRMVSLKTVLPTQDEIFMNQGRKTINMECYKSWIN